MLITAHISDRKFYVQTNQSKKKITNSKQEEEIYKNNNDLHISVINPTQEITRIRLCVPCVYIHLFTVNTKLLVWRCK